MTDGKAAGEGGVWIFAEQENGVLHGVVPELIGKGRELADQLGVPLAALLLGRNLADMERELLAYPLDAVLAVDCPELAHYSAEPYAGALAELAGRLGPEAILAGATAVGRAFLPRAAALLETGLTADCVDLSVGPDRLLLQTCPSFGGNVMASIVCPRKRPQMATVRPRVMRPAAQAARPGARLERLGVAPAALRSRTRRLEWLPEPPDAVNLSDADVVVAGGRGMGGPEGFVLLEKLAGLLGGALAATRPAVDEGWAPHNRQVGQTGRTVRPKLYLAFGISGAVHHLVGMSGSDRIVAVNRDPAAPIFAVADWGVAEDAPRVAQALIRELGG